MIEYRKSLYRSYLRGEEVKSSIEWLIKHLIKIESESLVSRPEMACLCGVGVCLGSTMRRHWRKRGHGKDYVCVEPK